MKKSLRVGALIVLLIPLTLLVTLWIFFGRGQPYPDLSGEPTLAPGTIEVAVVSPRPIGNAAVSAENRIFYTIHPESHPEYPKLYEWVDGKPVPYPAQNQQSLFVNPLELAIDRQNQLWIIDHGKHGLGQPLLVAFDLATNKVSHRFEFPSDIAPIGSFLQDLQVSSDGKWVYIADAGFWAKRPAIIVYDVENRLSRRVLNRHDSVYPKNYLIKSQLKDMSFFAGIVEMKTGIDGIALSRDDQWLYYGAMNHDSLFRTRTADLRNTSLANEELAARIELVGPKPLNDGFSIDNQNNVYITDVENQAVLKMDPRGQLETIIKDDRIRWADGLSFGPDAWLYLADSAIPLIVLQSQESIAKHAPFYIWRFKPGTVGAPGQ